MYEQYLRDPTSVGQEWRDLFDNGKLAELPVIPVPREAGNAPPETVTPSPPQPAQSPTSPVSRVPPPGGVPITGPAPRPVAIMPDSLTPPTATSSRHSNCTTVHP